jgi:hypothetical protein
MLAPREHAISWHPCGLDPMPTGRELAMAGVIPAGYTGRVPEWLESLLAEFQRHGFSSKASAQAGKTIDVLRNGTPCGYINETVLQTKGVVGYHFGHDWGTSSDSCPPGRVDDLVPSFCSRYRCRP